MTSIELRNGNSFRQAEERSRMIDGFRLVRKAKADLYHEQERISHDILSAGSQLLLPRASIDDVMALANYTLGDISTPRFHPGVSAIDIVYEGNSEDPIGWLFIWTGHEQKRVHVNLPKEIAVPIMCTLLDEANGKLAFSVLMKDETSLVKDGFTEEDLHTYLFDRVTLRKDRQGKEIVRYYKMVLLRDMFKKAKKPEIPIWIQRETEQNYEEKRIYLSRKIRDKLAVQNPPHYIYVKRASLRDFDDASLFQAKNSDHPTMKAAELSFPIYLFRADGIPIAMSGSVLDSHFAVDGNDYHLVIAGNLVVDRRWRDSGIGYSVSYAPKERIFKDDPRAIITADNRESTRNFWMNNYHSHVVATTGFIMMENK